jgi:hypothetical protein
LRAFLRNIGLKIRNFARGGTTEYAEYTEGQTTREGATKWRNRAS